MRTSASRDSPAVPRLRPWEIDQGRTYLDELDCALIEAQGSVLRAEDDIEMYTRWDPDLAKRQAERCLGTGATVADAIAKANGWKAAAEAEVPQIENERFDEVDRIWQYLFPGESLYPSRAAWQEIRKLPTHSLDASCLRDEPVHDDDDPVDELATRVGDALHDEFGFGQLGPGVDGDLRTAMRSSIGVIGMVTLLVGLREDGKAVVDPLVSRATAHELHNSDDVYNEVRVTRRPDGTLSVKITQRAVPRSTALRQGPRQGVRRCARGARARGPRSARRGAGGTRRVASTSSDDPPGSSSDDGPGLGRLAAPAPRPRRALATIGGAP